MPTPLAIGLGIGIPKCYYVVSSGGVVEWLYFTDDDEQDGYFVDDGFTARLISKDA